LIMSGGDGTREEDSEMPDTCSSEPNGLSRNDDAGLNN
jgi:hypothetical protein